MSEPDPVDVPTQPLPVVSGKFALYDDGKGGYVAVGDVNGETVRKHIPSSMVKLLSRSPLAKMLGV